MTGLELHPAGTLREDHLLLTHSLGADLKSMEIAMNDDNEDVTDRDGTGGVSVGVVRPALVVALVPRAEVLDQQHHPPGLLVVPGLLPLALPPLHLLQGQAPPGPLDGGGWQATHLPLHQPPVSTKSEFDSMSFNFGLV